MALKITMDDYFFPTLFKDAHTFANKCEHCQMFVGSVKKPAVPLQLVVMDTPFQQWSIDIVNPINPSSSM